MNVILELFCYKVSAQSSPGLTEALSESSEFKSIAQPIYSETEPQLYSTIQQNMNQASPMAHKRGNLAGTIGLNCYAALYTKYLSYMDAELSTPSLYQPLISTQTDNTTRLAELDELAVTSAKTLFDEQWRLNNNNYPIYLTPPTGLFSILTSSTLSLYAQYDALRLAVPTAVSSLAVLDSGKGFKFLPGFYSGVS